MKHRESISTRKTKADLERTIQDLRTLALRAAAERDALLFDRPDAEVKLAAATEIALALLPRMTVRERAKFRRLFEALGVAVPK